MTDRERLLSHSISKEDSDVLLLRPRTLDEFTGQTEACSNLKVFIEAAKARSEALDHVLFVVLQVLEKLL